MEICLGLTPLSFDAVTEPRLSPTWRIWNNNEGENATLRPSAVASWKSPELNYMRQAACVSNGNRVPAGGQWWDRGSERPANEEGLAGDPIICAGD